MVDADGAGRPPGGHRRQGLRAGAARPYQVLIVASIIEREAKVDEDRAKIARVIYNRLTLGMPLQIDATLFYQQDQNRPFDELKAIDTPYNTYLLHRPAAHADRQPRPGLDPGRAQPGAEPARRRPECQLCRGPARRTPCLYLYYVLADEDGGHAFAVTLDQHEANVRGRAPRRACCDHRRHHGWRRSSAPRCATACRRRSTTRRSRQPASTGCTSPSRSPRATPTGALDGDAGARARRPVGHDAAQGGRRRLGRRARPRRRGAAQRQHRGAARPTAGSQGYSTDGAGFVASLADAGVDAGRSVGGACSAPAVRPAPIVDALARAGAASVAVVNRPSADRAGGAPRSPAPSGVVGGADDVARRRHRGQRHLGRAWAADELPVRPVELLRAGQVVADIVYHPLRDGAARGGRAAGAPTPSTGSACSCTRRRCSSSCGTGSLPDAAVMPRRRAPGARRTAAGNLSACFATSPPANRTARRSSSSSRACRPGSRSRSRRSQAEMARRRLGYGRGPRQRFEQDELTLIGGVRHGRTLGSPVAIEIKNSEWFRSDKWHEEMSPAPGATKDPLTQVRPGHADLAGMQKYGFTDARDVLERASARETAARVAAGALAKKLLGDTRRAGHLARDPDGRRRASSRRSRPTPADLDRGRRSRRCAASTPPPSEAMIDEIKAAAKDGDSLGGVVEVLAYGVPVGLGSHVHWDRKLDAAAGPGDHEHPGREGRRDRRRVRGRRPARQRRPRRHLLGRRAPATTAARAPWPAALEGGITTGELLVVRAAMKPLATLNRPTLEDRRRGHQGRDGQLQGAHRRHRRARDGRGRRDDGRPRAGRRGPAQVRRRHRRASSSATPRRFRGVAATQS